MKLEETNNKNSLLAPNEKLQSNFSFREFETNSRYPRANHNPVRIMGVGIAKQF